ncbi:MAG: ribonuclease PH [Thermodesulfobacteriota bacterium]
MRSFKREADQIRPVTIERGFQRHAAGSVLIKMGHTHVNCAVTVEESVPPFLKGQGQGWITAEYSMLPASTNTRIRRERATKSGRSQEISRLIGRSLRMMVEMNKIGERTLRVDCDVINADGGTRTAAITGSALALYDAIAGLASQGKISMPPLIPIAAISAGVVTGEPLLDLDYDEDSTASADANFVMTGDGRLIEAQATAEGGPLSRTQFDELFALAEAGVEELLRLWPQ